MGRLRGVVVARVLYGFLHGNHLIYQVRPTIFFNSLPEWYGNNTHIIDVWGKSYARAWATTTCTVLRFLVVRTPGYKILTGYLGNWDNQVSFH